jgi:ketosteroid isomerase-like protein
MLRAMSRENVDLVKRLQPAGDDIVERLSEPGPHAGFFATDAPLDALADDFEIEFLAAGAAEPLRYRGMEAAIEGWRDWLTPWASYRVDSEAILDAGEEVVVLARVEARTSRDGVAVEHSPGAVWTIEDGKVTRIRFFLERAGALEAAGLPRHGSHGGGASG